jgi:NADPH-dependent ferric siderophore reductase
MIDRAPRRVRHELKLRRVTVHEARRLTPHLVRITLDGTDLQGFQSPGFDDHMKLFFPDPATGVLNLPQFGANGPALTDGAHRPIARDYTPRLFDPVAQTLVVDFALHEDGPATLWARHAKPGDSLNIVGPRGSILLSTDFDWHLLVGDDTALPAIARRLAELPAGAKVIVIAEVDGQEDQMGFETSADACIHWVHRQSGGTLPDALQGQTFPRGDYLTWVACESADAKILRARLISDHGANPKWVKASGYWRRGASGVHDRIDD